MFLFLDVPVLMNEIEQLLLNLPRLKYFEVSAKGSIDLTDGQAWERLTHQLITFDFSFSVEIDWIETILDSFRTPFWIHDKKWFVACTWERLFSVTHFSQISADTSFRLPLYSTIPDETVFFDKISNFILNDSQKIHHGYFRNVKTLEIQSLSLFEDLSTFIDLNHVENLIISSPINHSMISSLMKSMPVTRQFSINTQLTNFLEQTKNLRLEQIRILEINQPLMNGNFYVIEQLVRLFPNVEILRVKSIQWKSGIARLLDRFENLSSASFRLEKFSTSNQPNEQDDTEASMKKLIIDETRRLKHGSFICRRRSDSTTDQNQGAYFDFWIRKQVSFLLL
jgi:hypothetical protein